MPLVDLTDVRTALRIPATDTSRDDVLLGYIDAATAVIEDITGPMEFATRTETFDGGRDHVVLSAPATSVTSVTVNGTAVLYTPNLVGGVVYGGSQTYPVTFQYGRQNVVVTYTVGNAVIPANIVEAAQEFVKWRWLSSQQLNRSVPGEETAWTPSGYAVPRSVIEFCAPNMRAPGIA